MTKKLETLVEHQARSRKSYPNSLVCAASNVRRELKANFPKVKFSVRTRRFSGGNSMDVEWIDGPTSEQVDVIIKKYNDGNFNGMIDLYEYNSGEAREFTERYGSAKYVSGTRHYTRAALQQAADSVAQEWGVETPAVMGEDGNAYIEDEGVNVSTRDNTWDHHWMARQVIYCKIREMSF